MTNDACFVCFRFNGSDLDQAAAAFAARRMTVERTGDELAVSSDGGPVLRIAFASGPDIAEEAADITAWDARAAAMLPCDARFEILIDDLDRVLDEYGTLFLTQEVLWELTGGFVFNTWNAAFPPFAEDS